MKVSPSNKKDIELLKAAVEATNTDTVVYTTEKQREKLQAMGLVEINPDLVEGNKVATRATAKGVTTLAAMQDSDTEEQPKDNPKEVKTMTFELETGIEVPKMTRAGGKRGSKYPFAEMEVGQSFHIAATEEKPEPLKTLRAAASVYNRECKDENNEFTVKFIARKVGEDDPKGIGARVFRIQ